MSQPHRPLADDRPGAVLLRNSTAKQVDNARSIKAESVAIQLLESRGIRVGAVLDEQGTSGKDLKKRPVASKLVDELERGEWAAVAVIETSRSSRDPDLIDQHIFMRACRRGKALLLTPSKAFDFRNESDRLQYNVESIVNALEWERIRKRTWEGMVSRALQIPIYFGHRAPFGYKWGRSSYTVRSTVREVNVWVKDLAQAPLMEAIAVALDEEKGLAAVAARLNREGHKQPNGSPWYWTQIEQVLKRTYYHGTWTFGTARGASEDLWESGFIDQVPTQDVPQLAWYTAAQVTDWRKRMVGKGPVRVRVGGHDHPLLGILLCSYCRQPAMAQGARGYSCAQRGVARCQGQSVSEAQAQRAVRALLGDLLPRLADLTQHVQAMLATEEAEDLSGKLRAFDREISARFETNTEAKLNGQPTPADFWDKVKQLQAERDDLARRLANADQALLERRRLLAIAGQFTSADQFLELYDEKMTAAEQRAALGYLLKWVVVGTNNGRGNRARAWVTDYEATFPKSVTQLDPWISWLKRLDAA